MYTLTCKRMLGRIYLKPCAISRKLILLYHSVGNSPCGMSSRKFGDQMKFLQDHCEILSLTNLIRAKSSNKIQVALTFDDGYSCVHDVAAPIMQDSNIPAMVYLNTGWIGETSSEKKVSNEKLGHYPNETFLTWEEVNNLHQLGWEFGSHGVNHLNFAAESHEIIVKELDHSKKDIERRLQFPCYHFAYTWGKYTSALKKIIHKMGYHYAATAVHSPMNQIQDPLTLPRMNIANEYTLKDFGKIISGNWDYLGLIQRIKRIL